MTNSNTNNSQLSPSPFVQRGNYREACFIESENYQYYLELLLEVTSRYGMSLHAYCLMTNHIHLLATPEVKSSVSNTMKVVGSRYAQYINKKYKRTGTLWEGRHKSSLVQSDRYFLICSRYIELNPVAAGMVKSPDEYAWSSYHHNAWGDDTWLIPHEEYLMLGKSQESRCKAYRALFSMHIDDTDVVNLRKAIHYCQPTGDDQFRQRIEQRYKIKLGQTSRGRPKGEVG